MSDLDRILKLASHGTADAHSQAPAERELKDVPVVEEPTTTREAVGEFAEPIYDLIDMHFEGDCQPVFDDLVRYLSGDQIEDFVADFRRNHDLNDMGDDMDEAQQLNASEYKCEDCGDTMHKPTTDCSHDCDDETGSWWKDKDGNGVPDALEEAPNEGNEFSGALAQAKKDGKKEFEVDGKKYKVESEEAVTEGGVPEYACINTETGAFGYCDKDELHNFTHMMPSSEFTYFEPQDNNFQDLDDEMAEQEGWTKIAPTPVKENLVDDMPHGLLDGMTFTDGSPDYDYMGNAMNDGEVDWPEINDWHKDENGNVKPEATIKPEDFEISDLEADSEEYYESEVSRLKELSGIKEAQSQAQKDAFAKMLASKKGSKADEVEETNKEELEESPTMDTTQLITLLKNSGLSEEKIKTKLDEWANTPDGAAEEEATSHGEPYENFAQSVNLSLKRYLDAEDMKVGLKEHKVEDIKEAYKKSKGEK